MEEFHKIITNNEFFDTFNLSDVWRSVERWLVGVWLVQYFDVRLRCGCSLSLLLDVRYHFLVCIRCTVDNFACSSRSAESMFSVLLVEIIELLYPECWYKWLNAYAVNSYECEGKSTRDSCYLLRSSFRYILTVDVWSENICIPFNFSTLNQIPIVSLLLFGYHRTNMEIPRIQF